MKNPIIKLSSAILLIFLSLLFGRCPAAAAQNNSLNASRTLLDIGVVLDLGTPLGKMSNVSISMALDDFYTTHNSYTTGLNLLWRDSNEDDVDAASMALDLVKNVRVKAIMGPQTSSQAQFVAELGSKALVPILSFSATSPFPSSIQTPYFIRTALSDSSQVKAIAALIKAFGWKEAVPIYEDTPYGNGVIPYLTDALEEVDARVPYRCMLSHLMTDDQIVQELYKLETMQTSVFIVHLLPSLGTRLFFKANEVGMMSQGSVWIITSSLANFLDSMNSTVIQSMQGVLGVRPYFKKSKKVEDFMERWKRKLLIENPYFDKVELNILGLWAYDTVWALAEAVERVGQNSTEIGRLGVSEMGPRLRDAILKTNFKGLSGQFNLPNGQLKPFAFEIVNVIGKGEREIGFWTSIHGLVKKLKISKKTYSISKDNLKPIIWPGESTSVPKGWALPRGNMMRIGVPRTQGFIEFVNVSDHPQTKQPFFAGYSIDFFRAALNFLPYAIGYEFIPFMIYGKSYNALIDQVYFKNLDAVVGDITIVANRTKYVDFTIPYMDSEVTMIVLVKEKKQNAWIFLKPLRLDLWLTTAAAFVFTGVVVWVLEHQINDEFRGPLHNQIGVTLWFAFSTLVFAHRERLVSNGSKFVVIIWVFVVWILSNSYTASLTSLLTVQQLQPEINGIDDLIKNGDYVGYPQGSFVIDFLRTLDFPVSHLKPYATAEEYAEALSSRTVGAIFDETPYLRLFLAMNGNCRKYNMVGPIYKTGGFAFAFPIGSPLAPDISNAILKVKESSTMRRTENGWTQPRTNCSDQTLTAPPNSLNLDIFWILFLITGLASFLALSKFLCKFVYKNRRLLCDSSVPFLQRLKAIARRFNERDISHHTARPNEDLPTAIGHADNSPPIADGETTVLTSDVDAHVQGPQPLDCESVPRRRWDMLYRAWRFRSRYSRLHECS
ncbi:hypothetical protein MRB53_008937 [Persea americana]|uniref:Uncharacterized protein n=1 Tax=Persea americana TaxID=3435 RepID=A0ACC2LMZ6_PERAE|nr:hypothetical protein MRB53_008937 [Persea americana]